MKKVDPPSCGEVRERLVRGDAEAVSAHRGAKVPVCLQMQEHLPVVCAHAKQHRHGFVYREVRKPIVV